MMFGLRNNGQNAVFVPEDALETEMAKALNGLCDACIDHGGDPGGPYFSFPDKVICKGNEVAEKVSDLLSPACKGFASECEFIGEEIEVNADEYEYSIEANMSVKKALVEKIFRDRVLPFVRFEMARYADGSAKVVASMIAFRANEREV